MSNNMFLGENGVKHILSKIKSLEKRPGGGVSSWNDLTDRPFYEEEKEIVLYDDIASINTNGSKQFGDVLPFKIEEGKDYIVTFDGKDYECVGTVVTLSDNTIIMKAYKLGNNFLYDDTATNTGEPFGFAFTYLNGDLFGATMHTDGYKDTDVAVTVKQKTYEIHYLDPKFIRDMYGEKETLGAILPEASYTQTVADDGAYIDANFTIEVGKTYTVIINGESRECVAITCQGVANGEPVDLHALPLDDRGSSIVWFPPVLRYAFGGHVAHVSLIGSGSSTFTMSIWTKGTKVVTIDPKYIKDMYYTEDGGCTEVFPEATAVDASVATESDTFVYSKDEEMCVVMSSVFVPIENGKTYTVKYNGVEYSCVAVYVEDDGTPINLLGDAYTMSGGMLGTEPTGEPFCLMFIGDETMVSLSGVGMQGIPFDMPDSVTLSIYKAGEIIHHINPKYIKDMYYTEESAGVVLPETTALDASAEELMPNALYFDPNEGMLFYTNIIHITVGATYTVKWNGIEYKCVANEFTMGEESAIVLGDTGVFTGTPTGEYPFILAFMNDADPEIPYGLSGVVLDGSTSITLGIYGGGETVHQIHPKYIPEMYYAEPHNDVVLQETTFEVDSMDGNVIVTSKSLKENGTYIITWNGNEYKCGITKSYINYYGKHVCETKVDGAFSLSAIENSITIDTLDSSSTVTISIKEDYEDVHKIHPKYIEDMYYTGVHDEIVFDLDVNYEGGMYYNGHHVNQYSIHGDSFELHEGDTYLINIDGHEFETICYTLMVVDDITIMALGNSQFDVTEDTIDVHPTNEPFLLRVLNGTYLQLILKTDTVFNDDLHQAIPLKIKEINVPYIHKIPSKYLPDTVVTKDYVEELILGAIGGAY